MTDQARLCDQRLEAGKILKCILKQSQMVQLSEVERTNEGIALDFSVTFQNAK